MIAFSEKILSLTPHLNAATGDSAADANKSTGLF